MNEPIPETLDEAALGAWVGREMVAEEVISSQLLRAFRATLDQEPGAAEIGEETPPGLHWCLAQPTVPAREIGPDGHPARGGFLPPVPLPRRMWAGGRLEFLTPLRVGDRVERRSKLVSVKVKQGRAGPLCFVLVEHRCLGPNGLAIIEEHDIVYRGPEAAAVGPGAPAEPMPTPAVSLRVEPSPVLLFRYSALTFNGHRIHYDRDYCTGVEGYPGLIVHGPLQATMLMGLAATLNPGRPLRRFSFRATRPLFDTQPFTVNGEPEGRLWIAGVDGALRMDARAEW